MRGIRRDAEPAPGPSALLKPPYFARRVQLETAPRGARRSASEAFVLLHAGALDEALSTVGPAAATAVELPLDAGEDAIGAALKKAGCEGQTLLDLRAWAAAEQAETPMAAASAALRCVFRLARALQRADRELPGRVVVPTALGGEIGWSEGASGEATPVAAAAHGAAAGAWKAVAKEWSERVALRVIDLPVRPAESDWASLLDEAGRDGPTEVGLSGSSRVTPILREAAVASDLTLDSDSVALLVGGARGIVARIGLELAERFGCRLALLGRTSPGPETGGPFDRAAARRAAKEALPEAHPRAVNRWVEQRRREHEVSATLVALRGAGAAEVLALQGDASQSGVMRSAVVAARARWGRLDVIVHGAGIDRSRDLEDKAESELDDVLAPKIAGAAELFEAGRGARLVAVGSVSARFGNAGQIDYAAANESLAKLTLARGGLVLDYTAWSGVGMAAGLARAMRERGVDPLDPDEAAAATVRLIAGGATGEWVIAGRLADTASGRRSTSVPAETEVVSSVPGAELVRRATLTLEALAFLRDHRATSAGLLPGVVALEAMVSAALALEPSLELRGLRDVRFERPLKVFPGRPVELHIAAVRGHVTPSEAGALSCSGRISVGATPHHRATVLLGQRGHPVEPSDGGNWRPGPTREAVYRLFFHGPSFQVVSETELDGDRLRARSVPLALPLGADIPEPVRCRALARELAFQAAGAYLVTVERRAALPAGVGAIDLFADPVDGESVRALVHRRADRDEGGLFCFDADVYGEDGRPLERLTGLMFRFLAELPSRTAPSLG